MLGRRLWSDDMHSDYEKLTAYKIDKICFSGTNAVLRRLAQSLDHEKYSILFVSSSWLEIMPYGVSKGAALLKIMELENIAKEECAAFGDGENDLSMLEAAGCPVAMKNAMPALKAAAAYVTEEHCVNDGCAKWIDAHIL
jgi:HAD superfamily hydrolase (TIGR01484 family)